MYRITWPSGLLLGDVIADTDMWTELFYLFTF